MTIHHRLLSSSIYGMVEVMYHWDESKETGSKTDGWLVHGVLARCVFGPKTHDIDEGTRERTEHRYTGEPITTQAFADESRYCCHGIKDVVTAGNQLDPIESYEGIADGSY